MIVLKIIFFIIFAPIALIGLISGWIWGAFMIGWNGSRKQFEEEVTTRDV